MRAREILIAILKEIAALVGIVVLFVGGIAVFAVPVAIFIWIVYLTLKLLVVFG